MQAVEKLSVVTSQTSTMKAIVHHEYGDPDVLKVVEVGIPVPRDDEVDWIHQPKKNSGCVLVRSD